MCQRYTLEPEHPESEALSPDDSGEWMRYSDHAIQLAGKEEVIRVLQEDLEYYKNNWKRVQV